MEILTGIEPKTIRILIADSQQTFHETLRMIFESQGDLQIVGGARDVSSTGELTIRLKPDILLLDGTLSRELEKNGLHITGGYFAGARVLMMMGAPEQAEIVEAFRLGVRGVVPKTASPLVWFKSIRRIVAGEYSIGREGVEVLVRTLQDFLSDQPKAPSHNRHGLTRRELDIVERVARGWSNKRVGREFSICERTVKHHLTNIFSKIGVSSRLELALFIRDNNILEGSP